MATKKLTVEVDADVTKAKRRLAEMESSGGGSMSSPIDSAAEKTAKSLDGLGRKVNDFGRSAESASVNIKQAARAFAGMGIGMAMQYAANNMEKGSTAQRTMSYGASMAQGAAMGAMVAGTLGAAAGGALGAGKAWIDQDAQKKAAEQAERDAAAARSDSMSSLFESIKRTREWKATIDGLTNTETDLVQRQRELQVELQKREEREKMLKAAVAGDAGLGGDEKRFSKNSGELGRIAGEIDALKALSKQLEKEGNKEKSGGSAMDYTAVDSLARIGGSFASGEDGFRNLQKTNEEQLATLKAIEQKTGKKGTF